MGDNTFTQGKKLQHKYTGEILWVLKIGREQILCRTKDLREIWFYPEELQEIGDSLQENMRGSNRFL